MLGREQTRDDLGQGSVFKAKFPVLRRRVPSAQQAPSHPSLSSVGPRRPLRSEEGTLGCHHLLQSRDFLGEGSRGHDSEVRGRAGTRHYHPKSEHLPSFCVIDSRPLSYFCGRV